MLTASAVDASVVTGVLVLLVGVLGAVLLAGDHELRRRARAHDALVAARTRAQRAADLTPLIRDEYGYRAALTAPTRPLAAAPRPPYLHGRLRLLIHVLTPVFLLIGAVQALRPHPLQLHLDAELAGLPRVQDDQVARLLQVRARQQLDGSSGLVEPVVGRYGGSVIIAGAQLTSGKGLAAALEQLSQAVGVGSLMPVAGRPDAVCGPVQSFDGGAGVACLTARDAVLVGVLDGRTGATVAGVLAAVTAVRQTGVR
jgi:hypothetical protein